MTVLKVGFQQTKCMLHNFNCRYLDRWVDRYIDRWIDPQDVWGFSLSLPGVCVCIKVNIASIEGFKHLEDERK